MAGRSGSGVPPMPALLRLPPPIRCHIYRFVGVASWDGRPSRFDLHGRQDFSGAPDPSNFHGLLLLSHHLLRGRRTALLGQLLRSVLFGRRPGLDLPSDRSDPTLATIPFQSQDCCQRGLVQPAVYVPREVLPTGVR